MQRSPRAQNNRTNLPNDAIIQTRVEKADGDFRFKNRWEERDNGAEGKAAHVEGEGSEEGLCLSSAFAALWCVFSASFYFQVPIQLWVRCRLMRVFPVLPVLEWV